jgi:recombination protein RecT
MNASEVYADEIEYWNPITGELKLTPLENWKERDSGNGKVIGYTSFFRTINGFEKFLYMTAGQVDRHAKKYSKSYQKGNGQWVKDFQSMALKTVLKLLLSKYGLLSIEMQKALRADQAVLDAEGEVSNYPDAIDAITEGDQDTPDSPAVGQ